jgi:putative DNA primase/helicase
LRPLTGIANAPTLRSDGSLLDKPGYDAATGLLYVPQAGVTFPRLAAEPAMEDARKALAILSELISKYPFIDGAARSVALAAMLAGVIRRMLPTAPGFAFDSPVPGSGKGLLCDTIAYMAHGREPSSLTQGNEEETEKRISSALIRGDSVICIDNITEPLVGAKLLSVLTQQVADLRVLGHSELVGCDTRALFLFNGNNLTIPGDMCRRVLVCGIDPACEDPERRKFKFDPLERVKHNRGRYVVAALTVLLAYRKSGAPRQASPLGSYGEWSRWVRDALLWLSEADPVSTIARTKQADPVAEQIAAFIHAWADVIGEGNTVTVKAAIEAATKQRDSTLMDTFKQVAPPLRQDSGGEVDAIRLGKWLARNKDRVVDGRRLVRVPEKHQGNTQWRLERVSEPRRAKAA